MASGEGQFPEVTVYAGVAAPVCARSADFRAAIDPTRLSGPHLDIAVRAQCRQSNVMRTQPAWSDQPRVLRAPNGFQAIMRAEFAQDVLHVIVHGGAADMKLLSDAG